jgi:hypothetical protein
MNQTILAEPDLYMVLKNGLSAWEMDAGLKIRFPDNSLVGTIAF